MVLRYSGRRYGVFFKEVIDMKQEKDRDNKKDQKDKDWNVEDLAIYRGM